MPSDPPAPDRSTFDALTGYLKAHLVKTADFDGGAPFRALSETAAPFNDTRWFWTDDNAKAAELLCEPGNYDADPDTADAAIDFVLRLSQGPVIGRRGGPAELRVVSADPAAFRVETAFFILQGDLTRGLVRHALRFNDNRTLYVGAHAGDALTFRHAGRSVTYPIAQAIVDPAIVVGEREVVLSFVSIIGGHGAAAGLARLTSTLRVDADRPAVALTLTLAAAPDTTLDDVVLATGVSGLTQAARTHFRMVAIRAEGTARAIRGMPRGRSFLNAGPARSSAVVQEGTAPGFAYAFHTLFHDGTRLAGVDAVARHGGDLSAVINRYALGRVAGGAAVTIREERMLTGGGYYDATDHYADVMERSLGGGAIDPTMTYDVGAELNAIATHLLFAHRGCYARPPSPARLETLSAWYDRHIERFFAAIRPAAPDAPERAFTRGLAFAVLSLDCMVRARGHPRHRALLHEGVALILRLARRRGFAVSRRALLFGDAWSPLGRFLDCHAACLLALARASWHGDPTGRIAPTIHAAVRAIEIRAGTVALGGGRRERYQGVMLRNRRRWNAHSDTGFWSFKLGLTLRALHAVRRAAAAGIIPASAAEDARLTARLACAGAQLTGCYRWHGAELEVLTSPAAGETNSETQPWVALGLAPLVDERIVACALGALPDEDGADASA